MKPLPILFYSDNPAIATGLARITKDLALITSHLPQFRVGSYGRSGHYSTQLPWAQYSFSDKGEHGDWGEMALPGVWQDFAGNEPGILFCIQDVSRLNWLVDPRGVEGELGQFLRHKPFKTWLYCPVDGYGVGGKMTGQCANSLPKFDRLLAYSLFGKEVLEKTLNREVDWIPHGYNGNVFKPRGKSAGRAILSGAYGVPISNDDVLVGCVMTNQIRKDWSVAFGAMAKLKDRVPNLKFWAHVDVITRHWNLMALAQDFGLMDSVVLTQTGQFSSEQLSYVYSACDCTILPSLGEGWGFTNIESLACGVPCINGRYGAVVESTPVEEWLIAPVAERLEGTWNVVRPVWNPKDWADAVEKTLKSVIVGDELQGLCTESVSHLQWVNLQNVWKKWLLEGIGQ